MTKDEIIKEFEAPADALDNAVVIFAKYWTGSYEGSALVVYRKDGKMYEVNGSHCSCNGLEGQWSPEETTVQDLEFRYFKNNEMPYTCDNDEDFEDLKRALLDDIAEKYLLY